MAPMAYISNMKSPIGLLAYEEGILQVNNSVLSFIFFCNNFPQFFDNIFGDGELLSSNTIIDCLATLFCSNPTTVDLCSELIFIIAGTDSNQVFYIYTYLPCHSIYLK